MEDVLYEKGMPRDAQISIIKASWAQGTGESISKLSIPVSDITKENGELDAEKILDLLNPKHWSNKSSHGYYYHTGTGLRHLVKLLLDEKDDKIVELEKQLTTS